jgi:hypothetical protein
MDSEYNARQHSGENRHRKLEMHVGLSFSLKRISPCHAGDGQQRKDDSQRPWHNQWIVYLSFHAHRIVSGAL